MSDSRLRDKLISDLGNLYSDYSKFTTAELSQIHYYQYVAGMSAMLPNSLWLPAASFAVQSGTAASLTGAGGAGAIQGWLFDPTTLEHITTMVQFPSGWNIAEFDLWWLNQGAGAGDVRWRCQLVHNAEGSTSGTTRLDTSATKTAAAQNTVTKETSFMAGLSVNAAGIYRVSVLRDAAHAADTLANDALFIGASFRRVG